MSPRGLGALALGAVLLAGGCGGEPVTLGDGRTTAGASPTGPHFAAPVVVDSLSSDGTVDDDPSLTDDLTEIYFDSKRDGGLGKEDVWQATRSAATGPWSNVSPATELNTDQRETGIALAGDGLEIWFSSNRTDSSGRLDVFHATRPTRAATWSTVERVPELSTPGDDLVSAVTDSNRTMLLARRNSDSDDYDLFVATRQTAADPWGDAIPIAELDTDSEESDAFLASTGHDVLFTRSKDLWFAERESVTGSFASPVRVDALNSSKDDRDPWATDDLRYLVFSSNRSGSYLLYEAER